MFSYTVRKFASFVFISKHSVFILGAKKTHLVDVLRIILVASKIRILQVSCQFYRKAYQ